MKITDEQKINILLDRLNEVNKSLHTIRERVQISILWILGILFGVAGYLFQSGLYFSCTLKLFSIFTLSIIWLFLYCFFYKDLSIGFYNQRKLAIKLETILRFYDNDFYIKDDTLFPEKFSNVKEGNFFKNYSVLLGLGFVLLFLVIILFN